MKIVTISICQANPFSYRSVLFFLIEKFCYFIFCMSIDYATATRHVCEIEEKLWELKKWRLLRFSLRRRLSVPIKLHMHHRRLGKKLPHLNFKCILYCLECWVAHNTHFIFIVTIAVIIVIKLKHENGMFD